MDNKCWWRCALDDLDQNGISILSSPLPDKQLKALKAYEDALDTTDFISASIGRDSRKTSNSNIRSDQLHWVNPPYPSQGVEDYFNSIHAFMRELNQCFFIGVQEYECHFTRYQPGSFYRQHLDAFSGKASRKVSIILYLNDHWSEENGGELLIYPEGAVDLSKEHMTKVIPTPGKMVIFFSELYPHEVLPANKERKALTGWLRVHDQLRI